MIRDYQGRNDKLTNWIETGRRKGSNGRKEGEREREIRKRQERRKRTVT